MPKANEGDPGSSGELPISTFFDPEQSRRVMQAGQRERERIAMQIVPLYEGLSPLIRVGNDPGSVFPEAKDTP